VVGGDGRRIGRVFDVRVVRDQDGGPPRVDALLVGPRGLLRRLGIGRGTTTEVRWSDVVRREGTSLVAQRRR
jgi:hypothetical protein